MTRKPDVTRELLDGATPREAMRAPQRLRKMVKELGPLEPLCSCDNCLEMRMWREVHPKLKPTTFEQFHNLDEALKLCGLVLVKEFARLGAALGRITARTRRVVRRVNP